MARYVTVRLTVAQAEALVGAAAYCQAGSPEDWGQADDQAGRGAQLALGRAQDALLDALQGGTGGT